MSTSTSIDNVPALRTAWHGCFDRLLYLSSATFQQNESLALKVERLTAALEDYKGAYTEAQDKIEANKRHILWLNDKLGADESRKLPTTNACPRGSLVHCALEGNNIMFDPVLLARGLEGAEDAVEQVRKRIAIELSRQGIQAQEVSSFSINIYFNKEQVAESLTSSNICTREQFDAFFTGFSNASPKYLVVDVGPDTSQAARKLSDYVETFVSLPSTLRVICGGVDTGVVDPAVQEQLIFFDTSISGVTNIPMISGKSLFFDMESLEPTRKLSPLNVGRRGGVTLPLELGSLAGLVSPSSKSSSSARSSSTTPSSNPPPCNEHYLMSCSKGTSCRYSHSYKLTHEQMATLAENAKKAPCNWMKNGLKCPYEDKCCWGHVCPNGPSCVHLSRGKCWFKEESMHT
ncbi:hypothetical protein BDZ89DRAFT_5283 [Hymenopellis radicata]|nr:hypothetical protein BDZ89DRAFT_5283 [Hymenopellis radicata]